MKLLKISLLIATLLGSVAVNAAAIRVSTYRPATYRVNTYKTSTYKPTKTSTYKPTKTNTYKSRTNKPSMFKPVKQSFRNDSIISYQPTNFFNPLNVVLLYTILSNNHETKDTECKQNFVTKTENKCVQDKKITL